MRALSAILILSLLVGCNRPQPRPAVASRVMPREAYIPAGVVGLASSSPAPQPEPSPEPAGETCGRCGGSGKIKPDGRIEIACPDCGGDGKLAVGDMLAVFNRERAGHDELIRDLEDEYKRITAPPEPATPVASPGLLSPSPALSQPLPAPPIAWHADLEATRNQCLATGKPALVFFSGAGCAPCHAFERDKFDAEAVRRIVNAGFIPCKIDAEARPDVAARWEVSRIPAVFVCSADWRETVQLEAYNASGLADLLTRFLKRQPSPERAKRTGMASGHGSTGGVVYLQPASNMVCDSLGCYLP